MSAIAIIGYALLGLIAGTVSGLIGIGGAIIIIPGLVYFFGFEQHLAQGTTLALMVPPIGLLAALQYYHKGYVDLKAAGIICLVFFLGGLIGAKFATALPAYTLRKIFAILLFLIAIRMFTEK